MTSVLTGVHAHNKLPASAGKSLNKGWEMDISEFMKIGERIFTLKRLYNTRLRISRKDDFLPPRFLTFKRTGGGLTNHLPPVGKLLSDYYAYRKWSENGVPTSVKLEELSLGKLQGIKQ